MNSYNDNGETFGTKALNWVVIVGAAVLLMASVAAPAPKQATAQTNAPIETVVVTAAHVHHA